MTNQLVTRLFDLGFTMFETIEEAIAMTTESIFSDMKRLYCDFHKIRDMDFEAHVSLTRFCMAPDQMIEGAVCAFPFKTVKWAITATIPGVSPESQKAAYKEAWDAWAAVSGVVPVFTSDSAEANVLMGARRIDGPSGVLAESQLPCGITIVKQWYDTGENWARISLMGVACHEIGHALGLSHTNDGGLMDPIHNPRVLKPKGSQELANIQRRYGPPTGTPTPDPTPVPPKSDLVITIKPDGVIVIPGYRVTKVQS